MVEIRSAVLGDVPGILAIYNEVIATSTAVYSDAPVSLENRRDWMEARQRQGFPVLVGVDARGVAGFSSFGEFRGAFSGYRHTVEHSVHIRSDLRGQGLGRKLVEALFPLARARNVHVMIGAIDAANVGSIRFHERLGFEQAGLFREVGRKFDRWLDLLFMQRLMEG
jgi:phosphinothricin acetyltransferase